MHKVIIVAVTLLFSGCGFANHMNYNKSLDLYQQTSPTISLGQSKSEVLRKLAPVQAKTPAIAKRTADQLTEDGKRVEIHYVRTAWVEDGAKTDDEYTPYVFEDDILTAVGWGALGGPKTIANHERAAQMRARQNQQGNFLQNLGNAIYQDGVERQKQQGRRQPVPQPTLQAPPAQRNCTTQVFGNRLETRCF